MGRYSITFVNDQLQGLLRRIGQPSPNAKPIVSPAVQGPGLKHRLTSIELDELVTAYERGDSARNLAQRYGSSRNAVLRYLHGRGVSVRRRGATRGDQSGS